MAKITEHFGGGSLYLKCHDCNKHIASEEIPFPGTPEQQKNPRIELEKKKSKHMADLHG